MKSEGNKMVSDKIDKILIIDFGSQFTQLIARRVRELSVYCEIMPCATPANSIAKFAPKAIILSGGPESVSSDAFPKIPPSLLELNVPILGICYGQHALCEALGGQVSRATCREFGKTEIEVIHKSDLLDNVWCPGHKHVVWMSHSDYVSVLPQGFCVIAKTRHSPFAIIANEAKKIYGVQFHPEVNHTQQGAKIIENYVLKIAQCRQDWSMKSFIDSAVLNIQCTTGKSDLVLCALSGGCDSSVTAALVQKAIGKRLVNVFVNSGLLRCGEADEVLYLLREKCKFNVEYIDASEYFLSELRGIIDPEQKRKIIGAAFIEVFDNFRSHIHLSRTGETANRVKHNCMSDKGEQHNQQHISLQCACSTSSNYCSNDCTCNGDGACSSDSCDRDSTIVNYGNSSDDNSDDDSNRGNCVILMNQNYRYSRKKLCHESSNVSTSDAVSHNDYVVQTTKAVQNAWEIVRCCGNCDTGKCAHEQHEQHCRYAEQSYNNTEVGGCHGGGSGDNHTIDNEVGERVRTLCNSVGEIKYLAQGTLYPDVIESVSNVGNVSGTMTIKTHHNVGGLPDALSLTLIEPLRCLFKDEVRLLGVSLGVPKAILERHPFPGPGLAVRIIGEVDAEKCDILRAVDAIFIEELKTHRLYDNIWQAFAVLLPVQSVGVVGDARQYKHVCALRAVESVDGMTADFFRFNCDFLGAVATRITNEVPQIGRVVYDVTSKPPATIEWE